MKIGDRVYCVLSAGDDNVEFIGRGALVGYSSPGDDAKGYTTEIARMIGHNVPEILLDDGATVWGTEIWFCLETDADDFISGRTVNAVDIRDIRKKADEAQKEENRKLQINKTQGIFNKNAN